MGQALVFGRRAALLLTARRSAWNLPPSRRSAPAQVSGQFQLPTILAQLDAENIVQSQQGDEPPPDRQLAKRNFRTDGLPGVKGTSPTGRAEPEPQHRARSSRMVERRPERRERPFVPFPLMIASVDTCRYPRLHGERDTDKSRFGRPGTLPSPVGESPFAMVADGPGITRAYAEAQGQRPMAPHAAILKQPAMPRANAELSKLPVGSQIGVPAGSVIVIEARGTDRP